MNKAELLIDEAELLIADGESLSRISNYGVQCYVHRVSAYLRATLPVWDYLRAAMHLEQLERENEKWCSAEALRFYAKAADA